MEKAIFYEDIIYLDLEVANTDEYFAYVSNELMQLGYVKESFCEALMQREKKYPTGLPSNEYKVSIPHSDSEHIIKPFICFTRVKNCIKFIQMGTDDMELDVKFIFLLGFHTHDNWQVELLQKLMENFMDDEYLRGLTKRETKEDCFRYLLKYID